MADQPQHADTVLTPRDVLAQRISKWAGDASVYDYADRLMHDLDIAGFEVVPLETEDRLIGALNLLLSARSPEFLDPALTRRWYEDRYDLLHEARLLPCDGFDCDGGPGWRVKHGLDGAHNDGPEEPIGDLPGLALGALRDQEEAT